MKDDLFSLGLIILALATKQTSHDFYDWKPNNNAVLKLKNIEKSFNQLERNYSSKLVKKIKSLVFEGIESVH